MTPNTERSRRCRRYSGEDGPPDWTEFWFEQKYLDGLVEWKIGRAPFGDFAAFECNFQNLTFCEPDRGNVITSYIWNWPISQWMTRFKFALNRLGYIQFSIFDDNPKYLPKRDALLPGFFARSSACPGGAGMALAGLELL
jgi:porin